MQDWYQMPALVLTTLLLPAFGHLFFRTRDTRNFLWFLAFLCVVIRMFLLYPAATSDFLYDKPPWTAAVGQALAMLASGLFLGSLSPLSFRIGRVRILYAVPYTVPLILCAFMAHGVYRNQTPSGAVFWVFPALGFISIAVGLAWSQTKGTLPRSIGAAACIGFGGFALWIYFRSGLYWPLFLAESGTHIMTALLVISVFRRVSPGTLLSVLGFLVWSMPIFLIFPYFQQPWLNIPLLRLIVMAKVVAALGLILLALENELAANQAAGGRERRARREIEAYSQLVLSRRRVDDFDRQGDEICRAAAANSRFSQTALLLLHSNGAYRLCGTAGLDSATASALEAVCPRFPVAGFLDAAPCAFDGSQTLALDFHPWLQPGDDLERLHFTSALAVPMQGRSAVEGALLLAGLRNSADPLRADDLVPVETLAARLQSVRSQTRMLEKLIDSEKFAGLGQLAGNVTQQLNNPLTVILGYASLLEEMPQLKPNERKGVDAILFAARSMRSTLESLHRVARSPSGQPTAVSVSEMLADMERLHRSELLHRSIELRVAVMPGLPLVMAQAQQLRQALLHCLQFAMDATENVEAASDRAVRLEARAESNRVQILIGHSGAHFEDPNRAFDPFVPAQAGTGETAGLGLSLCGTILRDNRGHASAMNLEPRGAAIILELQAVSLAA